MASSRMPTPVPASGSGTTLSAITSRKIGAIDVRPSSVRAVQ